MEIEVTIQWFKKMNKYFWTFLCHNSIVSSNLSNIFFNWIVLSGFSKNRCHVILKSVWKMENFITAETVKSVLKYDSLIKVIEQALSKYSSRNVIQPVRSVVPVPKEGG